VDSLDFIRDFEVIYMKAGRTNWNVRFTKF